MTILMGSYFIGSATGLGMEKRSSISLRSNHEDEEKGSPRFHLCPSERD